MIEKTKNRPPFLIDRFLRFYCKEEFLEEIQGDLYELYKQRITARSKAYAQFAFAWDVLRFFKWSNIKKSKKSNSNFITMTRNNFKIAARVLWHQKTNTVLNVSSIAIGLACFLMIGLYIRQETSFDNFHAKGDRIYRVWAKEDYGDGQEFFYTNSAQPLAAALEANVPEVEATVQYDRFNFLIGEGEGQLNETGVVVSPNFFDVFDFTVVDGNKTAPLGDRNGIVLSQRYATKYFGNGKAVGNSLRVEIRGEKRQYTVSAIIEDVPENSGFQFDMMVSNADKERFYSKNVLQSWFNISAETYVLLRENSTLISAEAKLPTMVKTVLEGEVEEGQYQLGMQPLKEIHLDANFPEGLMPVGNSKYVYVLGTIGLLVLVMACINYTTLSTGQSIKRAKEVGVRKVVGAQRTGLIWHFLSESVLISLLATLIGVMLSYFFLPVFNNFADTRLTLPLNAQSIGFYIFLALSLGIVTGIYPAFVLSRLKLISILRGGNSRFGGNWIRKSLVVFQLLLTVFLITGTLVMKKQMNFMQNADLGFDKEAMVSVRLYRSPESSGMAGAIDSGFENAKLLKVELESNTAISNIGVASHVFGGSGMTSVGFDDKQGQFKQLNLIVIDPYYLSAFGVKIKEGRGFDPNLDIDKREGIILNQAAVDFLGLEEPIGKKLPGNDFENHRIIGVTENFNYQSLHSEVRPLIITQNAQLIMQGISDVSVSASPIPKLVFKYTGASLLNVKSILEEAWAKVFQEKELQFDFVDERLRLSYQNEARVNQIISIATVISIMIASFGLLGLMILVVNTKVKEIGIRKILGASPKRIFLMLFSGFSIQLLIAILLSVPITYFLMTDWLNDFAYKVGIGILEFGLSGLITLVITLLVISYHAIRVAKSNPVKALRVE